MNIVFNNLLKISIDNLFIVNKHELKDVDKKKLNYIYRFSRTGCKFNDDNSLGLKNFKVRDKILDVLNSNRNIIDKTITSLLDNKFIINDNDDYKFEIGKGIVLREGKDVTLIASGLEVAETLAAAEKLAADGVDAKVINIHTIKPLDEELVVAAAKETGKVVTVEEHSVIGGLGGAVCECLSEKAPVPVKRIGVNDVFGESGPATALLEKYGLDAEGIYKQIKEFV